MVAKGRILAVDDDPEMGAFLVTLLTEEGFEVEAVQGGQEALTRLQEREFDLMITDLRMKGIGGLELLHRAKTLRPDLFVIVITAFGSIESAVEAMKLGAYHYVTKPFNVDELLLIVQKAMEERNLRKEVSSLRREVEARFAFGNLIGKSKAMAIVFDLIARVAGSDANILIVGESGTGKELVAKAIHYNSPRRNRPFVVVNCAAIPENLLESELFGHVKGSFTGAISDRKGLFEEAQGGTLVLDEIAEMPWGLQAKLLRAIQEKEVRRVGSSKTMPVDVRIIASTNQDLEGRVKGKTFREDLYYRLNVVSIHVPPLRERPEDIPLLAYHFLKKYAEASKKAVTEIAEPALRAILEYPWPGNVRELENAIERAVILASYPAIQLNDLPPHIVKRGQEADLLSEALAQNLTLEELERQYIFKVLDKVGGNKLQAARILGIDRSTLYRKLER